MSLVTETVNTLVNGRPATLQTTLPENATDAFNLSLDISTSGVTQDVNIAVVIDISGSADDDSGSDLDGDGDNETVLEAEILAAQALFSSIVSAGYGEDELDISLFAYNGSATHLGTFNSSQATDYNAALGALSTSGQTNFDNALQEVIAHWQATNSDGDPDNDVGPLDTNHIVFMSDGQGNGPNSFADEIATIQNDFNGSISAIGVGSDSNLVQLNQIDTTNGASQITDVAQLSDAIITPPPPLADVTEVEVLVDGVSYGTFTPGDGALQQTPLGFTIRSTEITGFPYAPGETMNVDIVTRFTDGSSFQTGHSMTMNNTICFAEGTMIDTPDGWQPIESLGPGTHVVTRDGVLPVRWIGCSPVSARMLRDAPLMRPVRISEGAFGAGRPFRDLVVSPQHRVLIDDVRMGILFGEDGAMLAGARMLTNGKTVDVARDMPSVRYWHLVFDEHAIINSNGLWTESLHPNAQNIATLAPEARAELTHLFPDLAEDKATAPYPLAYPTMKRHEAELYWALVQRDLPNAAAKSGSRAPCKRSAAWRANFWIMTLRRAAASLVSGAIRTISPS